MTWERMGLSFDKKASASQKDIFEEEEKPGRSGDVDEIQLQFLVGKEQETSSSNLIT